MSRPALDPATVASLLESVGGDEEFLTELFAAFADEAPGLMDTIEAILVGDDFAGLHRAAHTLKSTSASLGALQLSEVSRALEESGRAGSRPSPNQVAEARELLNEALSAMSTLAEGTAQHD